MAGFSNGVNFFISKLISPDRYANDAVGRKTPKIVTETDSSIFNLSFPTFSLNLFVNLINHSQPRGPNGVSKTLQSPIAIGR